MAQQGAHYYYYLLVWNARDVFLFYNVMIFELVLS